MHTVLVRVSMVAPWHVEMMYRSYALWGVQRLPICSTHDATYSCRSVRDMLNSFSYSCSAHTLAEYICSHIGEMRKPYVMCVQLYSMASHPGGSSIMYT